MFVRAVKLHRVRRRNLGVVMAPVVVSIRYCTEMKCNDIALILVHFFHANTSQVHYVNKYTFVQNFWRLANLYIFGIIKA